MAKSEIEDEKYIGGVTAAQEHTAVDEACVPPLLPLPCLLRPPADQARFVSCSREGTEAEHRLTFREGIRLYPKVSSLAPRAPAYRSLPD